MPGQPKERLQRALDGQLRGRILAVAANAQRFTPILPGTVPSVDVKYGARIWIRRHRDSAASRP